MHIPVVEDGWFRGDLLGQPLVLDRFGVGAPASPDGYWHHEHRPLEWLLTYWEAVEQDTLAQWPALLKQAAQGRRIPINEGQPETMSADEVLWHVMQHEVRHTAQMVLMLRLLGHEPPTLDLERLVAQSPSKDARAAASGGAAAQMNLTKAAPQRPVCRRRLCLGEKKRLPVCPPGLQSVYAPTAALLTSLAYLASTPRL